MRCSNASRTNSRAARGDGRERSVGAADRRQQLGQQRQRARVQAGPDTDTHSNFNEIGPEYFRTVGMGLVAGREFTRADAAGGAKVAIVNEAFAKKFNLGRDAVGKFISDSVGNNAKLDIEIVGLVQDASTTAK